MGPDPVGKKPFLWPLKKKSFQKITYISLKSPRVVTKPFLIVRYMFLDDIHIFFFVTTFDFCDFDHWKNVKLEKTMPVLWPEVEFSAVFLFFDPFPKFLRAPTFFYESSSNFCPPKKIQLDRPWIFLFSDHKKLKIWHRFWLGRRWRLPNGSYARF